MIEVFFLSRCSADVRAAMSAKSEFMAVAYAGSLHKVLHKVLHKATA